MTRRVLAAAVLVGAIVPAACGSHGDASSRGDTATPRRSPATTAPAHLPRVLVLGDSNTAWAEAEIDAALRRAGLAPIVRGVPSYGLKDLDTYWLPELPSLLAFEPDVVLVPLGANDAKTPSDAAAFAGRLDRLMSALPPVPVVWVTHNESRPEPAGSGARVVNDATRAAPSRWPNLTVLDLAPLLAADPGLLGFDALHYSVPRGRLWFADQLTVAAQAAVLSTVAA